MQNDDLTLTVGAQKRQRSIPMPGWVPAVWVDVFRKDDVPTKYGNKTFIYFTWEIAQVDPAFDDGRLITVWQRYPFSLDDRSNLYGAITSYMGRSPEKGQAVDFEKFMFLPAYINIAIKPSQDPEDPYVDVLNVAQLPEGFQKIQPSGKYVRKRDRDNADRGPQPAQQAAQQAPQAPPVQQPPAAAPPPPAAPAAAVQQPGLGFTQPPQPPALVTQDSTGTMTASEAGINNGDEELPF